MSTSCGAFYMYACILGIDRDVLLLIVYHFKSRKLGRDPSYTTYSMKVEKDDRGMEAAAVACPK